MSSQFMKKAKIIVILIVIILITGSIHLTSHPRTQLTRFEQLVHDIFSPMQTALSRLNRSVISLFSSVANIGSLQKENEQLKEQVLALKQKLYKMAEYERENIWLREALDFKENEEHSILVSEVIGRSPNNLLSTVTINHGRNHGVCQGMAVMTGLGIVGTVHTVSARTATIILCTDSRSAIGAMVQDTGDLVLVEGDPSYSGFLLAKPLSKDAELKVGDVLVTSGLSQYFPKGMPIGRVAEIIPGRYQLSFTAYVEPFVDFSRLEYVFCVLCESE
ncbi:MAG: rod shape-determining protein MreC [Firmicutes bacterium]|nr:rod shape-determining protein MreC [Bacillota bacterium]